MEMGKWMIFEVISSAETVARSREHPPRNEWCSIVVLIVLTIAAPGHRRAQKARPHPTTPLSS